MRSKAYRACAVYNKIENIMKFNDNSTRVNTMKITLAVRKKLCNCKTLNC